MFVAVYFSLIALSFFFFFSKRIFLRRRWNDNKDVDLVLEDGNGLKEAWKVGKVG